MPIPVNPRYVAGSKYGLTRGTCSVPRRLEVVAVAGLQRISWGDLGAAVFRMLFSFIFLRTHTACCEYRAAMSHLPLYYSHFVP